MGIGSNIFAGSLARVSMVDPFALLLMIPPPKDLVYFLPYVLVLKIILSGLFFYAFLIKVKVAQFPALITSLFYAFSGYMIIYGGWYNYATEVVFFPLLLLAIETLIQDKKNWKYVTLSYAWLALYHPVTVYFYAIFPLLYFLGRKWSLGTSLKEVMWSIKEYVLAMLLGVGIGFIFFLPNLTALLESPRTLTGGISLNSLFQLNASDENITLLGRIFSNDFFGAGNAYKGLVNYLEAPMLYTGLLSLLLLPQAFVKKNRRQIVFFLALFTLAFLFLFFPFFRFTINGFSSYYYRLAGYFFPFVLVFLLGIGLSGIFSRQVANKKLLTLTFLGLLTIIIWLRLSSRSIVEVGVVRSVCEYLTLYYLGFMVYSHKTNQLVFKGLLLVVVCFELVSFSTQAVNRPTLTPDSLQQPISYNDDSNKLITDIASQDHSFYRIDKNYVSEFCCSDSLMQNYKGTGYYQSFGEKGYIEFLVGMGLLDGSFNYRSFSLLGSHLYLKELLGIKYGAYQVGGPDTPGYRQIGKNGSVFLYQNDYNLSAGFVYDKYVSLTDFTPLSSDEKDKVMLSAVVVNENTDLKKVSPASVLADFDYSTVAHRDQRNSFKVATSTQKKLAGKVAAEEKGMLFLSIPYNTGWNVVIDGKKTPIQKVNLGFVGVPIEKGEHQVEVYYLPPYLFESAGVSLLSVGLFLFLILYKPRKRIPVNSNKVEDSINKSKT